MQFKSFESSIKTTIYRKLYEIANRIEAEGIIEVMYVGEMYQYPNTEEILNMESRERINYLSSESLVFFKSSHDLSISSSYGFNSARVDDMEYVSSVLLGKNNAYSSLAFMKPVINEFNRLSFEKSGLD